MSFNSVKFSVISHAVWLPSDSAHEPEIKAMPPLLRRRASFAGKMALEVAYQCLGQQTDVPIVFCSRHGESGRSAELLVDLARHEPLSPTLFSLSVHNANSGLFSIARHDRTNNIALAAGATTVEHAAIEACGLLADGAPTVLLVAYDDLPPAIFSGFHDCDEQPYAWAWLMQAPQQNVISLNWSANTEAPALYINRKPHGLEVLHFFLRNEAELLYSNNKQHWQWTRHV
jgi:hypothetical protein